MLSFESTIQIKLVMNATESTCDTEFQLNHILIAHVCYEEYPPEVKKFNAW